MRRRSCSPTTSLRRTSSWTSSAAAPVRYSACFVFIATPDPATCSSARNEVRRTPARSTPARTGGPPELGRTRLRRASAQRHVAWRGGLCLCAGVVGGGDGARRVRASGVGMHRIRKFQLRRGAQQLAGFPRRRRAVLAVPVVSRRSGIGLARIAMAKRGGAGFQASWQRISATRSPAWSAAGPVTWIRCVAARSAASNSSARPATRLGAAIFATLHRGG